MKKNLNSVFTRVNMMVGVIVLLILTGLMTQPVYSQVRVGFQPRTSIYSPTKTIYNVRGDFTMIGNTNMTLVNYGDNILNSNNDMRYVDVDGDPATVNSSAATLALSTENGANPVCSNIIYAGLYWTGRAHDGGSSPNTFTVGGGSADYYNSQVVSDYTLTITQTGSDTRIATYTFQPASGDAVVFVYTTTSSTVNSLTVQVGGNSPISVPYTPSSGTLGDNWVLATFNTGYVINTGTTSITVNSLRKTYVNNTIDNDFRANITLPSFELNKLAVKLKHASGSYLDVTANSANIYYPSNTDGNMYSAYAEVTDYVIQHGPGEYTVGNIALREGNGTTTGFYGGWGLVVIYENSKMGWRDITLFDGHAYVAGSTTASYDLPVSGFSTTQSGDVNMKLGMMAGEGDVTITGDYFQIINQASNWVSLNHAGNAANNFFNSSIFTGGNARNPNLLNNTGMDISMFAIPNTGNSIITNNQSSTTFRYGSTQDTYIIFCIAMAVDAYRPEPEGLNTLATINGVPYTPGMQALPGQTIVYQLEVRNKGTEPINNAQVVIPMPYSASYVSSSASFTYTPVGNSAPIYDAGAGATGSIVWDLGTLPLPDDPDDLLATLTYTLQVTTNCVILSNANCEVAVTVDGIIEGTGATSNIEVSDVPFIQGYTTIGECEGEPIYDPVNVLIDAADYVNQNCQGTPAIPDFAYCNFPGGVIPVTEVLGNFPVGSRFYNAYPPVQGTTEYTINNPFPATSGTTTYYAVPPGITDCYYTFTITVTNITSSPGPVSPVYCQDDTAVPLTATPTNPTYTLYYYTTASGGSSQLSITPSTVTPGTTNYWVAEGVSPSCVGPRVPLTVTVHPRPDCLITGPDSPVCPLTAGMVYSAPAGMSSYTWSVSGNATIVGADNTQTVSVTAGSGCNESFTLSLTVTNGFGCSRMCEKEVSVSAPAISVVKPQDFTATACNYADQDAVDAAFTTWLSGFSVSGGCAPSGSYGTPVAPVLCTGGTTTVTYTYSDLCESGSVQATFTIDAPTALTVNAPTTYSASACNYADQDAVDAAFTTWLSVFSVSGGCAPSGSYGTPVAPVLCTGGTTTVTYTYSDLCESGSVQATFTIDAPTALTVNAPTTFSASACNYADQDAVNAAFTTWLSVFSVSDGCAPSGSYGTSAAPVLCTGGTTTVTYTYSDLCESGSVQATFTITAPTVIVIAEPADFIADATDFADQAAIDAAFSSWLEGFGVTGGCNPQGSYGTPTAPTLCGGFTEVTYNVTDLCQAGTATATFTIVSPNPLVINEPEDYSGSSCTFADQASVDAAFADWLTGFSVSGGFNPVGTIVGTPLAPVLCQGGTTTVTYNVTDECGGGSATATFTLIAPSAVSVAGPEDASYSSCDFADQAALNTAFAAWIGQFAVTEDGCGVTAPDLGAFTAPVLCEGGEVSVTFAVNDLCTSAGITRSFKVTAPAPAAIAGPVDFSSSACQFADQAALNLAFDAWIGQFEVTEDGCGVTAPNLSGYTAPVLCEGGMVSITYGVSDLCTSASITRTFTITAPLAISVNKPMDYTEDATFFADQDAINAAFSTWLEGFSVGGGCAPQASYGTPTAPTLCGGSVTVTYSVSDLCETTSVNATFTINSPNELVINKPNDVNLSSCAFADQAELDAAFAAWLNGFSVSGGFNPVGTIVGTPLAPVLCQGGTTTVTYNVTDECGGGSATATFTLIAPSAVSVAGPEDASYSSCDFADQAALNTAFAAWIGQFAVTEDGCGVTAPDLGAFTAPVLCEGGEVSVTFAVNDLCTSAGITRSFKVTAPAPAAVAGPVDFSSSACQFADQAALNLAFDAWIGQFEVTEAGCGVTAPDLGAFTAPVLCEGGMVSITYGVSDLCTSASITRTFTITAPLALSVNKPMDYTEDATFFADQDAINAAFSTWLEGFSVSGGCDPQASYGTPTAPTLCGGTTMVTYNVSDLCETTSVNATFTINSPNELVINKPNDVNLSSCAFADQDDLDEAFDLWLEGFGVSGGFAPQGSIVGTPVAPVLCQGGSVTVTYNVSDECGSGSVSATYAITAPAAVSVSGPANVDASGCDYADQEELDAAFAAWIGQFAVTEDGCGVTAPDLGAFTAPVLCEGGEVSVTFAVNDLCTSAGITRSFKVTAPAPAAVAGPVDFSSTACQFADQAALNLAFDAWIGQFEVTEAGCGVTAPDLGAFTAPVLCEGGMVSITYGVSDLCTSASITRTFTITAPVALSVNKPMDYTEDATFFADQDAINAAFSTWLEGFSVSGGCDPQASYGTPTAPTLCGGTTMVTYNVSDLCETTSVNATFTINSPNELVINKPNDVNLSSCAFADQDELDEAFDLWLEGFGVSGGFAPQGSIVGTPEAPVLCQGGSVTVTYNVSDECGSGSVSATYAITAPAAVAVAGPANVDASSCAFADQAELDAAFAAWIGQFAVTEDGCGVTAPDLGAFTAPVLCEGGEVSVTFAVNDLCTSAGITRSFKVTAPAPAAVAGPVDFSSSACQFADQAALNLAFDAWIGQFEVTEAGCGVTAPDLGAFTAPVLCEGGMVSITYGVSDLCTSASITRTFTITAPLALSVNKPMDYTEDATFFADQDAINAAFSTWLEGFSVSGGCDPQASYGTPTAPTLCGGTTMVTYNVSDLCETTSVNATFTINSPNELVINKPNDVNLSSCAFADQDDLDEAFDLWLEGFGVSGGFAPQGSIVGTPVAPVLCQGGSVTVTYNVSDECGSGSVSATYAITAPAAVSVSGPANVDASGCDYADQEELDAAFAAWIGQFAVTEDGCGVTAPDLGAFTAPVLCEGGEVSVTFAVNDLCTSAGITRSFKVTAPAPAAVAGPVDFSSTACQFADQAALDLAFDVWIGQFEVTEDGCGVTAPDLTGYTAPVLCEGGMVSITYSVSDLCTSASITRTFTITAPVALSVNKPMDYTEDATFFADQDAINAAFSTWLEGFSVGGGCDPQASYGTPTAPTLCGGSVTVTYSVSDLCETTSVNATFTINSPNELVINKPNDVNLSSCAFADQDELDEAFDLWLEGFGVSGGFAPQGSIVGTPEAPVLCQGGSVTVTYNVSDECGSGSVSATYAITAPAAVSVAGPANVDASGCDYADQEELDAAFAAWIGQFEVTEDGCGVTAPDLGAFTAPVLCEGGEVSVTFAVNDLCTSAGITRSFKVTAPAPAAVAGPVDFSSSACQFADQAALNLAFDAWIGQFEVTEAGCGVTAPDLGAFTAPVLCEGGMVSITYGVSDLCTSASITRTFTITAPLALSVNKPMDYTEDATFFADQDAINAAFSTWLEGFSVGGGCDPQASYGTPTAPTLCGGSVTVTYSVSDLCETTSVNATFTINSPNELVINKPNDVNLSSCAFADQAELDAAFAAWLNGFSVSGGFAPQGSIVGTPEAPVLCQGGSVTVTYNVSDECGSGSVSATYAITAPAAVSVSGPANVDASGCDYADQEELDAAFASWIGQFEVTEDGCGVTVPDLSGYTAPVLCEGGTVTVTYGITDLCSSAGITRTFTVTAPSAVSVAGPADASYSSCDFADQAALNTAFAAWLGQFAVTGDGCGVIIPDLSNYAAPVLCEGGEVSITYSIADLCTSAGITRTFSVTAPTSLVLAEPDDFSADATDFADQAAIDAAFASWLEDFGVTGGCNPQGSYGMPSAPTLCGGFTEVTYNVTDLCQTGTATATFTIVSPNQLVINEPEDYNGSSCTFTDQAAVDAAFAAWLAGFSVSGGFNPAGAIVGTPVAPVLCQGGTTTVTYNVTDECGSGTATATFTLIAPAAVSVSGPEDASYSSCDFTDQAALNTAFAAWLGQFAVTGDGCGVIIPDLSGYTAPVLCEGGTVTVTYGITDLCSSAGITRTFTLSGDAIPPAITNTPPSTIVAPCGTPFDLLPWQLPEWTDNCGTVTVISDVTDPAATAPLPATYTRTWAVTDACGNPASFTQTIQVPKCEEEYCTVTQFTLGSSTASFCDGTSSYDLMESLLQEHGPLVVGLPANNRSFTVPVAGGAQCIIDRFPSWNNAFVLTGNYSCGNFGDLLQPDGRFNNTLLVEAITMQFNLWLTPALGDLLLENSAFYIRSASGCGGEDDYPLDDSTYYEIHPSVYNYLGPDPTVQDLLDLANLALGTPVIPGPNAPTKAQIKYALKYINEAFENCGFIYFVPPLSNKIELAKTGTIIDNEPFGVHNAGDQVSYQFAVSNIGNLTFSSVYINDPLITVNGGPIINLAPGATDNTTFSGVYTITQEDIDSGSLTNTATVIGLAGVNAYYDTDDDVQTFTRAPSIGLVKSGTFVDNFPMGIYNAGDQITYTFDITNTGNVTLTDIVLSDPLANLSGNAIALLSPGMTNSSAYTAVYTLTETDIAAGSFTNTAFVTGFFGTTPVTASAEDTQSWSQPPMIEVCTLTEEAYSDQYGDFCNGQTIYDLIESLMYPDDPLLLGLPANNRTFSVPVDGGAQCITDILPGEGFANKLTGNWSCGNFGYLLNNDGKLYNTLLSQMIALELNMRLSPGLADVVLTSPEFYTRASSACGGGTSNGSYPLDDSLHFVIPYSVYLYLGINPTIQDVYDLANSALGGVAPPPNLGPTLSDIRDAVQVINQAFEDCRFIFFIPKPKSSLVLPLGKELPVGIELKVAPNPFRSFTEVSFSVDKATRVQAQLYDMQGNLVKNLFEGNMEAGQERTEVYNVSRNESFAVLICVIRTPTAIRVQRIIRAH